MISILVTITPIILVTVLALTYYKLGIEGLFSEKISSAISKTVDVAELYLKEHKENIKADVLSVAKYIDLNYFALIEDKELFTKFLDKQAELLNLSDIIVFQKDKGILVNNSLSFSSNFEELPTEMDLRETENGNIKILNSAANDKVRAVIKLNSFGITAYLLVGMRIDQSIITHLKDSQGSADHYQHLMYDMHNTLINLEIAFAIASFVLCVIALISGIKLARFITDPINRLVEATEAVGKGDFSIRIPEASGKDETAVLTRSFNSMISTLAKQRSQILQVNQIIDERRRFIEKVLAEISSGVVALTPDGIINFHNTWIIKFLGNQNAIIGKHFSEFFLEVTELVSKTLENQLEVQNCNIEMTHNDKKYNLFIRSANQLNDKGQIENVILTFDDITDLVSAQRSAAWSDVARRIAHEIKNPLTPIQLCAERLKSKYKAEIKSSPEKFEQYADTIIRHVENIGQIVEEFVQFARIPIPRMKKTDIIKILSNCIFEQENAYKNIQYEIETDQKELFVVCDDKLIGQSIFNILKNAAESINAKNASLSFQNGNIFIKLTPLEDILEIKISDNGMGFDKTLIDRIFEPYITTKESGMGLGMSIVKKIIEDHGGRIQIGNSLDGAYVKFTLFIYQDKKA